jgi:deoxyribodipyrimidine photo-lyase
MASKQQEINIFWFRRDLRLVDNVGFSNALKGKLPVVPIFIFDENILKELPEDDARLSFIYDCLAEMHQEIKEHQSALKIYQGQPKKIWDTICKDFTVKNVITNRDYEPYALERDEDVKKILEKKEIGFYTYKDQVIFEKDEVTKADGLPYTVYTPFKNKWYQHFEEDMLTVPKAFKENLHKFKSDFPTIEEIGFKKSSIQVKSFTLKDLDSYAKTRDIPSMDGTSYLSPHLRFGTIGIRQLMSKVGMNQTPFINELIWREFFMQILFHFPKVVNNNFREKYDGIQWRNDEADFEKWCKGETGYPMVDAGMRQLNETGYMHNRVRMVTAGFLVKHLLIDWRKGEAYFAQKLLDYDLSANNGNWQWAAGTGCDAAPYFRIFNPITQLDKFDKQRKYVKKWIPELETDDYAAPMVEHKFARERALEAYKKGIK